MASSVRFSNLRPEQNRTIFQKIEVPCQIELIEQFGVLDYVSSKLYRKYYPNTESALPYPCWVAVCTVILLCELTAAE